MTTTTSTDYAALVAALGGLASIVKPPPNRNAAQWADECRVLPPGSPEPGRWRSSRVPYTIPIYEAFSDPRYTTIVGVMGAQMSKTELLVNVLGHRFTDGPYVPALYIAPTEKAARTMSSDRVMKMLRTTPVLWERLAKGHANKVTEKWIAGIRIGFGWAGSATELASNPAGLALVDERDRMSNDVESEGDPVELVRARGSNYWGFKLGVFSTPTLEGGSPIWSLFEEGTMCKWAWHCIHCGEAFIPRIELLKYNDSQDFAELKESAVVVCPNCGGTHENKHKRKLNEQGRYIPHAIDKDGKHVQIEAVKENSTASFWVSGLCSPWQTFGQRAESLVKAYRSREPGRIQGAINTAFGELYKLIGEKPSWEEVYECRTAVERGLIPNWSKLITVGADVQKNGIYYVVRCWGFNNRSHLIDHGFVTGETEFDDVWLVFKNIITRTIDGVPFVNVAFIDSGYKPGLDNFRRPQHKVYDFCRRHPGFTYPTKGHDTLERPIKASKIDVTVSGRIIKGGLTLWHVDTDHLKSWVHAQINIPEEAERLWTLHSEIDEDYCRQIVAEELLVTAGGRRKWIRPNKANHYFDCEVLARAAAMSRNMHSAQPPRKQPEAEQPAPVKKTFVQRDNKPSWFRR